MNKFLEIMKFLLPIAISLFSIYKTSQANKDLVKLKAKLNLQNERKNKLSESQRAILFIIQNMTANTIATNDNLDIEKKIEKIMKNKTYNKIFSLELFNNSIAALFNEISLSTCSEKVMAIRLRIQERSYEDKNNDRDQYYIMVLYSIFYKYLYFDFTGNEIDDLYLLKYNVNDFSKHVKNFKKFKDKVYSDLISKNNWNNLKN